MTVQFITAEDGREMALLPREEWERLMDLAEEAEDLADAERLHAAWKAGEIEAYPAELVYALGDGANPVRTFREHRGLTVEALATAAGLSRAYVTQIEIGVRTGTAATLAKLAKALGVDVEMLIWEK